MVEQQSEITSVTFEQLANLFVQMDVFVSPSELHGILCGQLAHGGATDEAAWLREVAAYLEREQVDTAEAKRLLIELLSGSRQQMQDSGFDLDLVLPDDDTELTQRVESVGLWCQGFLAGFGGSQLKKLSEEARESLKDFTQIAQIERDGLDDSDDNEQDLMQVIEYVRMVAIMIYSEVMGGKEEDSKSSRSLH